MAVAPGCPGVIIVKPDLPNRSCPVLQRLFWTQRHMARTQRPSCAPAGHHSYTAVTPDGVHAAPLVFRNACEAPARCAPSPAYAHEMAFQQRAQLGAKPARSRPCSAYLQPCRKPPPFEEGTGAIPQVTTCALSGRSRGHRTRSGTTEAGQVPRRNTVSSFRRTYCRRVCASADAP